MPDSSFPLPASELSDGVVELRMVRFLDVGDLSKRDEASAFLAVAPEYRFAIHRRSDGLRVGRIHVRVTARPDVVLALGHIGFEVDEEHRRQGYASRAVHLMKAVAHHLGQKSLWILIEPHNVASRRTVERAGFLLVDEVATLPPALALGLGPRLCRYSSVIN